MLNYQFSAKTNQLGHWKLQQPRWKRGFF